VVVVVQPETASHDSAAVAALCTISASMQPHTGYSSVSQPKRAESTARPRVAHW
jgi:hypothetical protein